MTTATPPPRTNTKEVKAKIQAYIIECISTDGFPVKDDSLAASLELICSEFKAAACYKHNILRLGSFQDIFIDWLQGLPSCLNIEYWTDEIIKLMESFGLPLPQNKTEQDGVNLFHYLIFREFVALCRKNKVDFWAYCNAN